MGSSRHSISSPVLAAAAFMTLTASGTTSRPMSSPRSTPIFSMSYLSRKNRDVMMRDMEGRDWGHDEAGVMHTPLYHVPLYHVPPYHVPLYHVPLLGQTAAATASPISLVDARPPRSPVRCFASAITLSIAASMRFAASTALGSPRLRPSHSNSIFPDMIMA